MRRNAATAALPWALAVLVGYAALLPGAARHDRVVWLLDWALGAWWMAPTLLPAAAISLHGVALAALAADPGVDSAREGGRIAALLFAQEVGRRLLPLASPRSDWGWVPSMLLPATPSVCALLVPFLWRRGSLVAAVYVVAAALFTRFVSLAGTWDAVFGGLVLAASWAVWPQKPPPEEDLWTTTSDLHLRQRRPVYSALDNQPDSRGDDSVMEALWDQVPDAVERH